jgi:hypothetical protein
MTTAETSIEPTPVTAVASPLPIVVDCVNNIDTPLVSIKGETIAPESFEEPEMGVSEHEALAVPAAAESEPATTVRESEPVPPSASVPAEGVVPVSQPAAADLEKAAYPEHVVTPEPETILTSSPSQPEQAAPAGTEKVDSPVASGPEQVVATAVSKSEASTHAPVSFSKTSSKSAVSRDGNAVASPTPGASEPAASAAPATANAKADKSACPSSFTDPTGDKISGNGKKFLTGHRASSSKEKLAFPRSEQEDGDKTSTRTGSFSLRKKRHSMFGGTSEGDDNDASISGSTRKKTRSFFGKVKHLFDRKD